MTLRKAQMFWSLVSENYEKLSMHHVVLFCSLILYSYLGALMFVHLEGSNEAVYLRTRNIHQVRNSVAAKKNLVDAIQVEFDLVEKLLFKKYCR